MDRHSPRFGFWATMFCQGHMIFTRNMATPEKKPKTQKQETELDAKSKRCQRSRRISKHIHPHNDESDSTAYMGNYNFPQMLFAFCVGFATMFVLAVDDKRFWRMSSRIFSKRG